MSDKILHENDWVRLVDRGGWTFVARPGVSGIVMIVGVTDEQEVVLVEQYRAPVRSRVVELPAGLVGDEPEHAGESLEAAARREFLEETGFEAEQMIRLGCGTASPGITDDTLTVFHARGLSRSGDGGGVEGEDIHVHLVPRAGLARFLREREREGSLVDLKLWAGLSMAGVPVGTDASSSDAPSSDAGHAEAEAEVSDAGKEADAPSTSDGGASASASG